MPHLPALQQEGPVHGAEPHDAVPRLEVPQLVAAVVEEVAQTLEQLARARLDNRLLGRRLGQGVGLGEGGAALLEGILIVVYVLPQIALVLHSGVQSRLETVVVVVVV